MNTVLKLTRENWQRLGLGMHTAPGHKRSQDSLWRLSWQGRLHQHCCRTSFEKTNLKSLETGFTDISISSKKYHHFIPHISHGIRISHEFPTVRRDFFGRTSRPPFRRSAAPPAIPSSGVAPKGWGCLGPRKRCRTSQNPGRWQKIQVK